MDHCHDYRAWFGCGSARAFARTQQQDRFEQWVALHCFDTDHLPINSECDKESSLDSRILVVSCSWFGTMGNQRRDGHPLCGGEELFGPCILRLYDVLAHGDDARWCGFAATRKAAATEALRHNSQLFPFALFLDVCISVLCRTRRISQLGRRSSPLVFLCVLWGKRSTGCGYCGFSLPHESGMEIAI